MRLTYFCRKPIHPIGLVTFLEVDTFHPIPTFLRILLAGFAMISVQALAARSTSNDDTEKVIRTVYFLTDYGLGTYKSKLMEMNDTNSILTYGIGAYTGEQKDFGFEYRVESTTTAFALNSSTLQTKWDTSIIKYRFWYLELGAIVGSVNMKANREGTDIIDALGSGYGGYFGIMIPVGRHSTIDLKVSQVSTGETVDRQLRTVAIGPRQDIELSTRIALTKKSLDLALGYRRRSNTITEGGTSFAELQTSTFLGFVTGLDF